MMNCHLIEQAKSGRLTAEEIQDEVGKSETVHESDRFDIEIVNLVIMCCFLSSFYLAMEVPCRIVIF